MIACATIVRNGRVLLVRHSSREKPDYGYWLLPAGRVEAGEGAEEALKREIKEELGLSVKTVRELVEHTDPYTGEKLINFLCIPSTSKVRISSELAEAEWMSLDKIGRIENIHTDLRQFLTSGLGSSFFQR